MSLLRRLASVKVILATFLLLAMAYSVAAPVFEMPDELWHFFYVKSLVEGRGFPVMPVPGAVESAAQESSQPPLYYIMAALVVRLVGPDMSDWPGLLQWNPAFPNIAADGTENDNKNLFVHTAQEIYPFRGTVMAIHLTRLIAVLFGGFTVVATYRLGREAFPGRPSVALVAASTVAFTPQFAFLSAACSNDSTAAATCALALWAAVRTIRRGWSVPRSLGLGGALALAALSKASALGLIPLVTIVVPLAMRTSLSADSRKSQSMMEWGGQIQSISLMLGAVTLVAGPWYVRSYTIFGDLTGITTHLIMPWAYQQPVSLGAALSDFVPATVTSFWLAFGWATVTGPDWVYAVLNALALVGLLGAVFAFARSEERIERWCMLLMFTWLVLIIAALIRWNQLLGGPLGRLAFPALSSIGVLLAVGWTSLRAVRSPLSVMGRIPVSGLPPLFMLALSAVALPAILLPAYARPVWLTEEQLEQQPGRPVDVRYGDVARLVRIGLPGGEWPRQGGSAAVRLCWETLSSDPRPWLLLVQIIGTENRIVATRRTYPGLGTYPTGLWQPDVRFCDSIRLVLPDDVPAPAVYRVEVAFVEAQHPTRLPAYAPDGSRLHTNFVDAIKVAPGVYPSPLIENALEVRLGDQIDLIGYALSPPSPAAGSTVHLRLYWRALRRPDADYTVFVHVFNRDGRLAAQADAPPRAGTYPTSFWDAGEIVLDERAFVMPAGLAPGEYSVVVGLYQWPSGERLAVTAGGQGTEITLPVRIEVH